MKMHLKSRGAFCVGLWVLHVLVVCGVFAPDYGRAQAVTAPVPYFTDFESGVGPEWSAAVTEGTTGGPFTRFAGRYSTDSLTLSLTNLVAGQSYTVLFDLDVIDSWDGDGGPDWFNVIVDGTRLFHYTFNNFGGSMTYPGTPDVGPVEMGYGGWPDSIYRSMEVTFNASATSAQITFQGENLQGVGDESWGVDNVRVDRTSALAPAFITASSLPEAGATNRVAWDRFTISSSRDLTVATAGNAANYTLREAGANGTLGDGDDVIWVLTPTVSGRKTVSFVVSDGPVQPGLYRFETHAGLLDSTGNPVAQLARVFRVAHPVAGLIESLHNNTLPEAMALALTESPEGSGFFTALAAGTFSAAGDVDYWRVEAQSNDVMSVRLETDVGGVNPQLFLANPADANLVAVGGDSWSATFYNYRFTASGSFYFRVYNNNRAAAYQMRVDVGRGVQLETENNDSPGSANPLNWNWGSVRGEASFVVAGTVGSGDTAGDYYALGTLSPGNTISARLVLPACGTLTATGAVLTVEQAGNTTAVATNTTGLLVCGVDSNTVYYVRIQSPLGQGLRAQYLLQITVGDTVAPYILSDTLPAEGTTNGGVVDTFSMTFSEDLDLRTVNSPAYYELRSAGRDGVLGNADDVLYPVTSMGYSSGLTASYQLTNGPLQAGAYRFQVAGLKDRAGNEISPVYLRQFAILGGAFTLEGRTNDSRMTATSLGQRGTNWDGSLTQWGGFGVGANPWGLAKGDLNGDGIEDLVVCNWSSASVSVLLGIGDGTFGPATNYPCGDNPMHVAVGDVDGDGKRDVVVANYYWAAVDVLLGNGDGTLKPRVAYGTASYPRFVVLSDLNGDGKLDIATANETTANLSVLTNKGGGVFSDPLNYNSGGNSYGLAARDLDGDGKPELVVGNYGANSVTIFGAGADGSLVQRTNLAVSSNPRDVAVVDLNKDGRFDIVTVNAGDNTISVLLALAGGGYAPAVQYGTGGSDPYSMAVADLNNDGAPDVVVANWNNALTVLINNGNGTFLSAAWYGIGGYMRGMVAGDFNRDGVPELVTGHWNWNAVYTWYMSHPEPLVEDPPGSGLFTGFGRGKLRDRSDYDYWSFSGKAGDQMVIAAEVPGNPYCSQLYYRVERTDGDATGVLDFYSDGYGRGQAGPTTLPVTGRYTVYVRYNCDYYGEYRLRVTLARPPLPLEWEGNSDPGSANHLTWTTNNPQETVIAGFVGSGDGGGDFFALENLAQGATITMGLQLPLGGTLMPGLEVYRGSTSVASSLPGATNLVYALGAGADGTYYARVYAASNTEGIASQYILRLSLADSTPPYITSDTFPPEGSTNLGTLDRFALGFSEEMRPVTVLDPARYEVRNAGGDGTFGTSDDEVYRVECTGYSSGLGADYRLPDGPLRPGHYRLRVSGLKDRAGNVLAPVHDRLFTVEGIPGYVLEGRTNGGRGVATSLGTLTTNIDGSLTQSGGFGVGANPWGLAKGDLNGDGIDDLVVCNWSSATVSVLLGLGDGSFGPATNFACGDNPMYAAVGDLNGDGKQDVVVANYYWAAVDVLMGNGDGTLQPRVGYGTASYPRFIALSDFNSDGKLDIATANETGWNMSVLMNVGDGTFHGTTNYSNSGNSYGVVARDIDGDGKTDLVVGNYGANSVSLFSGNGDGTFVFSTNLAVSANPRDVAVSDLNKDGIWDIVTVNAGDNTVSVLLGLGGGAFAPAVQYGTGGSDPYSLAAADLSHDGVPDLAVANWNNSVTVLVNNGNGTFKSPAWYGIGGYLRGMVAGDFNRDGLMDLATTHWNWNGVYTWLGNHVEELAEDPPGSGLRSGYGRGNLKDSSDYDYWSFSGQAGDLVMISAEVPGSPYCSQLYFRVERVDGDATGVLDFYSDGYGRGQSGPATLPMTGRYTVYVRYNCGYYGEYRLRVTLVRPPVQMESEENGALSQANNLAWTTNNPQVAVVYGCIPLNDGADCYNLGNQAEGTTISMALAQPGRDSLVAGMEIYRGDTLAAFSLPGDAELIYTLGPGDNGAYRVRVYPAPGSSGIEAQYLLTLSLADLTAPYITSDTLPAQGSLTAGVWDRFSLGFSEEMKPATVTDLASYELRNAGADTNFATADDQVYRVECTGYSSGLGAEYRLPDGPLQPGNYRLRVSGLRDRAGNLLSPVHERFFTVAGVPGYILEGRTNDSRVTATSLGTLKTNIDGSLTQSGSAGTGANPWGMTKGDLNGDGFEDLVVCNWSSSTVSVLLGNGDGTFKAPLHFACGDYPMDVAVGDVNGDGKPDVVVANIYWHAVDVLLGNGDGTLQPRVGYGTASYPHSVVLSDFNGDGKLDIATPNESGWNLSVLMNIGDGTFHASTNYSSFGNSYGIAAGDVDGDNKTDLIVGDYGNSSVSVFKGAGDGTFAYVTNIAVHGNPRQVALADMTGDGILDVVSVNAADNTVSVAAGLGGGAFAPAASYADGGSDPYGLAVADMNKDGRLDVLVANWNNSVSVLMNKGDGTLAGAWRLGIGGYLRSVVVGDFNRDGVPDMATTHWNWNAVCLWSGNHVEELAEDPPGSGIRTAYARGNIKDNSDYDYFSFSAKAGDLLQVAAEVPGNPWYTPLYFRVDQTDGDGTGLIDFGTDGYGRGQSSPVSIPGTGRYTVYARYSSGYQGEYRLRVTLVRPPIQMEWEDNGSPSAAIAMAFTTNNPQQASVFGYISSADGGDFYTFGNLAGGSTISLGLTLPNRGALVPGLVIYRNGTAVTNSQPADAGLAYRVLAGAEGVYCAQVYAASNSGGLEAMYVLNMSVLDQAAPYITGDSIPANGSTNLGVIDRFTLSFSEDMKPETVTRNLNYELRCAGSDTVFGTFDDLPYTVECQGYSSGLGADYRIADGPLQPGAYRLRVSGLRDRAGNVLASVYERQFVVQGLPGYVFESRTNGDRMTATKLGTVTTNFDGSLFQWGSAGTGANPWGVAQGDFNGDGIPDLAVCNWSSSSVSVLLGNGDMTFKPAINVPSGDYSMDLVVGDVNGDGKLDIVVANIYWHAIDVLLGNGDGTFQPRVAYGTGNYPHSLVLADFNGDGKLDIATANETGWNMSVLMNVGDGTFHGATNYSSFGNSYHLAAGDMDADGKIDLMVADYGNASVSFYKGAGDGTFVLATNLAVRGNPRRVEVADMNGDGRLDVVTVNAADNTASLILNSGGGVFAPAVSMGTGGSDPYGLALADLDKDGRPEILVANWNNSLTILYNQGGGAFSAPVWNGIGGYLRGLAVADFNRDGLLDVATPHWNWNAVCLWQGNHVEDMPEDPLGSGVRTALIRGNIKDNSDYDYYRFSGRAGDLVTVLSEVPGSPWYTPLYYRVERTDGDATGVAEFGSDGYGRGQVGPFALPATGIYTLYVRYSSGYQGEYRARVTLARPPTQMESEDNGAIGSANVLAFATNAPNRSCAVSGSIRWAGERDFYNLGTVSNGQTIILSTRLPSTSRVVPVVSVHNASDFYMLEAGNGRPLDGVAEVRVSESGVYYAVVEGGEGTGGLEAQYLLNVLVAPTGASNFANLFVTSVQPPAGSVQSGQPAAFSYSVQNSGAQPTPAAQWSDRVVLSVNRILGDADDVPLGIFPHYGALAGGATYTSNQTVRLPDGLVGDFYLIVETDAGNQVDEGLFEADNVAVSAAAFHIDMPPYPDLRVENLAVAGPDASDLYTVTWTTANRGTAPANGGLTERVFIRNATLNTVLTNVEIPFVSDLPAGATLARSALVKASVSGSYQVAVTTDSRDRFFEYDGTSHASAELNNLSQSQFAIGVDLQVASLRIDPASALQSGQTVTVRWDDLNTGDHAVTASWSDRVEVVNTNTGQTLLSLLVPYSVVTNGSLGAGLAAARQQVLRLPEGVPGVGTILVSVTCDAGSTVIEYNAAGTAESNNVARIVREAGLAPYPDLVVTNITAPASVVPGQTFQVTWAVTNIGQTNALAPWADKVMLSSTAAGLNPVALGSFTNFTHLGQGLSLVRTGAVAAPSNLVGDWYLMVQTDSTGNVVEGTNEANNTTVLLPPIHLQAPDLVVASVTVPGGAQFGRDLQVVWTVRNSGDIPAPGPWSDRLTLSNHTSGALSLLGTFPGGSGLAAGHSVTNTRTISLPLTHALPPGPCSVLVQTDVDGAVRELSEENNAGASAGFAVAFPPLPDLAVRDVQGPASGIVGQPVRLTWMVTNLDAGIASGVWTENVYLLLTPGAASGQLLASFQVTNTLGGGAFLIRTQTVTLPSAGYGSRYLAVQTDVADTIFESNETNNQQVALLPLDLLSPDLSVDLVTVAPSSAQFSQSVDVTWVVRNAGNGPASSNWNDLVALSLDAFPGNDIPLWTNAPHGALALGQSYTNTARVVLPLSSTLLAGAYSILVTADPANLQPESTKANNVRAAGITIAMPPLPDLVVSEIRLPASAPIGQPAAVSWVISNQGPAQASGVWTETVSIAVNPAGDGLQSLGAFTVTNTLASGASITRTQMVALPAGVFGNRHVVVAADTANRVIEGNETNNAATSGAALVIRAADLVVESVAVAAGAQFGRPADVTWTVRNRGGAPAVAPWTDRLFFSGAPALATARPLSPAGAVRTLAAGASYTNTQSVTLPLDHALAAGGFYVLATADADNAVLEENELDNTTASVVVPVAYPPLPDLTVTNVHGPAGAVAGLPTPVTWALTNRGAALASGAWNERLFACDDTNGSNPQLLATFSFTSRIPAGDGLIRTQRVMLPVEWRGARYFKAQIDSDDALFETSESNNTAVALQPSMISAPDLQVVSVSASPASAQFGEQVRVTWVVQNTGEGPASSSWSDRVVFSSSGAWGGGAILATQPADSMLEPGQSYTNFVMATLPLTAGSAPGTWHLMVMADIHNVLAETVETNNVTGTPIAMGFPPLPDLAVRDVALFDTNGLPAAHVLPGQPAILVWTTTNAGSLAAAGSWVEAFTVTTNESGAGGVSAGVLTVTNPLPAGGFLVHTQAVTIPLNSPTGRGYWVVSADAQNVLIESDEANNSGVAAAASDVSAVLSLQLASQNLYEGASIVATVSRNGDRTAPLTVLVTGSDPAQMYSPASVVIPAGQGSVSFNLVGVADGLLDGNRMVLVGVSADGFGPAQASLTVMDTDVPKLMLAFEASTLTEGRTVAATVSVMPAPARDQSISVFSSRASRLLVPATVTLLAGQTNVTFAVLAVDNVAVELPVSATVSVTASGYAASAGTLTILDNDAPELSLVLDRSSVSEAGGPSAAYATLLNARTNGAPLVLFLEASIPELVRLPSSVTLPANSTRVSFAVGVVDDLLTNGPRTVSVRAYPTTTYGNTRLGASAGAMLLVNDNEGPTLQLAFDREILSAADHSPVQGRVIRSGPLDAPLTVSLVSGDLARLTASGTVIIPAGQSNATVTVTTVDDHALRGSASVTLTASAPGCNDGSARLVVTHDLLPDLVITELSAPAVVTGGDVASVSFRVANTGLAPAVGSWVQQVFLSTNPVYDATATLLGQFPFTGSLSAGQTIGQALSFYAPSQPGQYYVIAMADSTNDIVEVLEDNNLADLRPARHGGPQLHRHRPVRFRSGYGGHACAAARHGPARQPRAGGLRGHQHLRAAAQHHAHPHGAHR